MNEWIYQLVWMSIGAAFASAMIAHLRILSIARDARRIADALEGFTLNSHRRATNVSNEVHDYLE